MGTRADFYVGRGEKAEWLGSVGYDGYPDGVFSNPWPREWTEEKWRERVANIDTESWTSPEDGWPWPWEDSLTTDYAYTYDDGAIWVSNFGYTWVKLSTLKTRTRADGCSKSAVFPNMKHVQNVAFGHRSGMLILGVK